MSDISCCNEATMPSTDQAWEPHSVQSLKPSANAATSVLRDRPVVKALSGVVLNGAEYICRCLVGLKTHALDGGRHESEKGEDLEGSIEAEEASVTCVERVVEIGWEKQPQEGDTELRALSVSVRPYLPEHENDEFISVKLNAVRQAFEIIIADPEHRRFFKETGFTLLSGLLALAGKRNVGFGLMWEQLMTFLENSSNWRTIAEECQEAGLLECKEHIPATLKQTLHIPWISASMKKTTVMFYAWSQIKKKRLCMTRDHGLYHHLYEVFDYVDPEIMWAAFGLQSEAKDYYFLLRSQVLAFIRHIFSLRRSWYDSPARLTSPIYSAWQDLVWKLQCYLEENIG